MPVPMMAGSTSGVDSKLIEDVPDLTRKMSSTTEGSSDGGSQKQLDAGAAPFYPMGHDQVAAYDERAYHMPWDHWDPQMEHAQMGMMGMSHNESPQRPHGRWESERHWDRWEREPQPEKTTEKNTERQRAMVASTLKAASRKPAHHAPPVDLAELHRQILEGKEITPGESTPRFPPKGAQKSVFDVKLDDDTPSGAQTPPQMSPMSALFLKAPPGLDPPPSLFSTSAPQAPPMPRFMKMP